MTWYSRKPLKLRTKQFRIVVNDEIKQNIFGDIFEKLWKMNVLICGFMFVRQVKYSVKIEKQQKELSTSLKTQTGEQPLVVPKSRNQVTCCQANNLGVGDCLNFIWNWCWPTAERIPFTVVNIFVPW